MSSIALSDSAVGTRSLVGSRSVNMWVGAIIVVVPTFMEILDTTVATVALRYLSGGVSDARSASAWLIASYLAANAIVLPIAGWLSSRLGRRGHFLLPVAVFTFAS